MREGFSNSECFKITSYLMFISKLIMWLVSACHKPRKSSQNDMIDFEREYLKMMFLHNYPVAYVSAG